MGLQGDFVYFLEKVGKLPCTFYLEGYRINIELMRGLKSWLVSAAYWEV